ncbi:MAG: hypothetical protein JWO36_1428 [Myxococcales bacterium]|nr:hypothetical protein [Myxococcales bacterium]
MFVYRTRGVVTALGALTFVACTDPLQRTDLRPDGPPEVLAVLVNNDPVNSLSESATFCKVSDDKRPTLVGLPDGTVHTICSDTDPAKGADEVVDAAPQGWYVRIEFDELLNPDVEDITPILDDTGQPSGTYSGSIANTRPVTLQCESSITGATGLVDVGYDGYYSPAGNNVTWPLGPSLVIKPNDPTTIGAGKECQVTIKDNVLDKDGNPVPAAQRGPYKFKVAPIQVVALAPADGDAVDPQVVAVDQGIEVTFNTNIDLTTFDTTDIDISPTVTNLGAAANADNDVSFLGDFPVSGDFTFTIKAGAMIADACGVVTTFGAPSVAANTKAEFTTNALKLVAIAPFDTAPNAPPGSKIKLDFNQEMDATTLLPTEISVTPTLAGLAIKSDADPSKIVIAGNYAPSTDYTFTLKAGATIDDCPGATAVQGFGPCVKSATYTNAADQVVHFHTAAIALTAISPKDNATVTKAAATSTAKISLTFNQTMDPTSLTSADYTIDPAVTLTTGTTASTTLSLTTALAAAAGTYTFTLKQGAVIKDVLGNDYTVAADRVIHFTVKDPAPTPPPHICL